eukprot:6189899-Pleurochrysis_carterae.AAC.2
MSDKLNDEGAKQAERALKAMERPRKHTNTRIKEEEELALRQMISAGIIPEWQEADNKEKKGTIMTMRLWTGVLMNWARIQMKTWIEGKNRHKASVQRRWDNRGKMHKMFLEWKRLLVGYENKKHKGKGEEEKRRYMG